VIRRALVALLAFAPAAVAFGCRRETPRDEPPARARIASLAPGITETLFAIGAGRDLVARSDYCDYPPEVRALPPVGTNLTPSYEVLSRLAPTLIVGEANAAARNAELRAIAKTRLLPWLTLPEIVASIRELGRLTGHSSAADALAEKLRERLDVPPPVDAPRVLLVIGYRPGEIEDIWFVRDNSLHGAALRAAGGENAVPEAVGGLPRLSVERLLEIDPDAIFVLVLPKKASPRHLDGFKKLGPLHAVRAGELRVIEAPEAFVQGPRILELVERLRPDVAAVARRAAP
jgi:iron complex transport system substrate-binding protein